MTGIWEMYYGVARRAAWSLVELDRLSPTSGATFFPRHKFPPPSASSPRKMSGFVDEKRMVLAMGVEERRRRYRCGSRYTTVESMETWPEYYKNNTYACSKASLEPSAISKVLQGSTYRVDDELNGKLSLFVGDITTLEVDAVVNAANNTLSGGGGVDGAIHRAAGRTLYQECLSLNGCHTGDAKITGGYSLPARYVIHTVGPVGEKPAMLESCYRRAMQVALENNVRTMAFPCISTGVYGYPNEAAAMVALPVIRTMLEAHPKHWKRIVFCLFMEKDIQCYLRYLPIFFPLQ